MKKVLVLLIASTLAFTSCMQERKAASVDLGGVARFRPGDNLSWASPGFDDSEWDTLHPGGIWEYRGHRGLDGYAWYRFRVMIPSSLKETLHLTDSVKFMLGKIDDYDQVFLNGQLIGENGRTLPAGSSPGEDFNRISPQWQVVRKYILSVGDPRIRWDSINTIAVRVFDQGGAGGMFEKPYGIAMVGLEDYLAFDFTAGGFHFTDDAAVSKSFRVENLSSSRDLEGMLNLKVLSRENGTIIIEKDTQVVIPKGGMLEYDPGICCDLHAQLYGEVFFTERSSGQSVSGRFEYPYILTPAEDSLPRINGASVFGVRPWSPFLFRVAATGKPPLKYYAMNLPDGLKIDSMTGIIRGTVGKKGEYVVRLMVENGLGHPAERDLTIKCGNLLSLTPPLGWNSWNCWGLSVSDQKVRESAGAMRSSGLAAHGWTYINIDDGWEDKHDKDGKILPNGKFPDMKALCDHVHSLGLKIGIYSSPGPKTCGGYEGSYTFEEKDAQAYAAWGIDYLKYDWCSYGRIAPNPSKEEMKQPYRVMKRAIRSVNRDIHYSLCQYGMGDVWEWGAEVDGNSWRTTGDIEDSWESMSAIGFSQDKCSPYAAPGRWNDPDMLVVGWVGWGPALHYTRLTPSEQYTHITLWCLLASPLLIGCDLSQIDPFTYNLLSNDEVLAVNQDPLGKQAVRALHNDRFEIWIKEMADGSRAVGLFNKTESPEEIPVGLKEIGLQGRQNMRDLWRQKDLGPVEGRFNMTVMPHGAALLKFAGY